MNKYFSPVASVFSEVVYQLFRLTKIRSFVKLSLRLNERNFDAVHALSRLNGGNSASIEKLLFLSLFASRLHAERLRIAVSSLQHSRSQFIQDIAALVFNKGKSKGFFVEVGVGNGVDLSNTHMLEKEYSWKGILVEPNKRYIDDIRSARSAFLEERAAFERSGCKLVFEDVVNDGLHSRLAGSAKSMDVEVDQYEVETATLTDILEAQNAPSIIDYLSIDVEGAELSVLKGLDLKRYKIVFLNIEHNNDGLKRNRIRSLLEPHGYKEVCSECSTIDAWYIHGELASL